MDGLPHPAGTKPVVPVTPGRVRVRIVADAQEAHLIVSPSPSGEHRVTLPQALTALKQAGVCCGIDTAAVEELLNTACASPSGESRTAVVARGVPATRGEDSVVTYHDLLQTPSDLPQLKGDGSVDYFDRCMVRNTSPGTVLAIKRKATRGTPGTNVLGVRTPCVDGTEVPLKVGRGCAVSPDGLSIVAEVAGHSLVTVDGRVAVSPIFEVHGDVDTGTGDIDFDGTVVVQGSVNQGFTVRAGHHVEIHGGIDGGSVEAGGDLTVRYGIAGGSRGRVTVGGRIQCRFVENADVRCGRDLVVSDGILHSRVRSGGRVVVIGRRGSIIGGHVKAKEEVSSRVLGSGLLALTEIEVGVAPGVREESEVVRRTLHGAEEGLRKAQQAVALLREIEARHPHEFNEERRSMLLRALRSQYHTQG